MDSSDDQFDYKEVEKFIFNEFIADEFDSKISDDEDADMIVTMSILEKIKKKEKHVRNFKGSIKGRIIVAHGISTTTISNLVRYSLKRFFSGTSDELSFVSAHSGHCEEIRLLFHAS